VMFSFVGRIRRQEGPISARGEWRVVPLSKSFLDDGYEFQASQQR